MTRNVLLGRAGSPGVGLGRLLLVAPEPNGHVPVAAVAGSDGAAIDAASERARLLAALDTAATDLEALARQVALRAGDEVGAIFEAQALVRPGPWDHRPGAGCDRLRDERRRGDPRQHGRTGGASSPPSMTSISGRAPRMSATSAGGLPTCSVVRGDPTCGTPMASRPSSSPRTSTHRPSRHSALSSWLGSPSVAAPRRGTRRSSLAASASRSCSASAERRRTSRRHCWGWSTVGSGISSSSPMTPISRRRLCPTCQARRRPPTAATSGSPSAPMSGRSWRRRPLPGRVPPGSVSSGPSCCSSAASRRLRCRAARDLCPDPRCVSRPARRVSHARCRWRQARGVAGGSNRGESCARSPRRPLGLDRPALLDDQLTALLEAATGGEIRIMLPMVATVDEVVAVRRRLDVLVEAMSRGASCRPPSSSA